MITFVILAFTVSVGLAGAFGWVFSSHSFILDLLIAQQMLFLWAIIGAGLIACGLRRWRLTLVLGTLAGVCFWPLVDGRSLFVSSASAVSGEEGTVRVLTCNINPKNEHWDEGMKLLMSQDADVIILIEVPPELNRAIKKYGYLDKSEYPYWEHRKWVDEETSPGFILSRTPLHRIFYEDKIIDQHILHTRVDTPSGAFLVGLMHPLSPRDHRRWILGNGVVEMQADTAARARSSTGLPVVIGADLNSSTAQLRARTLRDSGMQQSKPLLRRGGSYPVGHSLPWWLMVQIDDIWHSDDVEVAGWDMVEVPGSDHKGILVDLLVPKR